MRKFLSQLLVCLFFASATALAQVYQSTDADGNTVFSDQPLPGGVEVDVNPPNVADPMAIPVAPPEAPARPEPQPSTQQQPENVERIYEDDDRDGRVKRPRRWRRIGPRHPRPNR